MFFKFLLMFFTLTASLFATSEEEMFFFNNDSSKDNKERPLFISLGGTCHVAIALRALELRDAAYPLDWIISTNHAAFLHVLRDKFARYTDPSCFHTYEGVPRSSNWYYNLGFPHDFNSTPEELTKEKALQEWDFFKERYDRRVERFQSLASFQGKVYFFRAMWSFEHEGANGEFQENSLRARQIRDTLASIFPNLDFTLVIITDVDLDVPRLEDIPNVVEFRMGKTHKEFYEKIAALIHSSVEAYVEPNFIPQKKSPFKRFFFERKGHTLYFCTIFPRKSKNAITLLQKAGLRAKRGRKTGRFQTKNPKIQMKLLKLAHSQGAIPSESYSELLEKIKRH